MTLHPISDEARERLDADQIASGNLLAISHIHRYDLARALAAGKRVVDLCCGVGYGSALLADAATSVVGVDIDPEAVAEATARFGERATFTAADALAYVEALPPEDVDLIVCFEGMEHVPDPEALADALGRHVREGVRVVISLPNSAGFDEDNDFHTVSFGYEQAIALFDRIGEHALLSQRLAEGSIISDARDHEAEQEGAARVRPHDTSAAWAGHWLAVYGEPAGEVTRATVELRAVVVPNHHQYMRALERANEELYRTNLRLSRPHLGKHDAAAGITVGRLERALQAAEEDAAAARAQSEQLRVELVALRERLDLEVQVGLNNDAHFQVARQEAEMLRARLREPRHRAVDALHHLTFRVPGGRRVAAVLRRRRR